MYRDCNKEPIGNLNVYSDFSGSTGSSGVVVTGPYLPTRPVSLQW
jgi:hypothetical protein